MKPFTPGGFAGLGAAWKSQSPVIRGVVMMCASTVAFAVMHFSVRVASSELHPFQIAFFRNLFGLAFLVPLLIGPGFVQMRTRRFGLHALRGVVNIAAMFLFFTALAITPLAKVTALGFTAPIFTSVLSVLIFKEKIRLRRWTAIGLGFVGMLIILRPGLAVVETGSLLVIAAALLWSLALIIVKTLSRTESSVAIVAWMGIFLSVFSVGPALWVWKDPTLWAWGWLLFIGFAGSVAQVSLSQALKETEPTAVMPFDFLKLIWAALLAFWFLGEIPDEMTFIGAAVIFGSGLYVAQRERAAARASK
ncbi:Riboflavin transporter [Labrenzia sp. THAF82]|uniref:DMT family transporter n=1 Tax=Labrenzia sp. THAF82 TaxID=2587861 RepID=UPI001268BC2D|nr:DMT family transporter [Labrenzia sp. THAF82]QFT33637.1 Riboflavin transporter [Labrenzia sp. THAF82]